ncbi:MAG: YihY/virulence factor BrkB family protein, partial [Dongiaceae bacterium]
ATAIDALLASAGRFGSGILGTLVGILTFLVSATAAFIELQDDLNIILKAQPPKYASYWVFLRQRFLSFAMIMAIGFLLLVSLTLDAALSAAGSYFGLSAVGVIMAIVNLALSLAMSVALFVLIFKILPNVRLSWKDAVTGALVTGIMFVAGKFVIGFYLGRTEVAANFGTAASVITILLWIYYSSQILLLGAEFIKAYTSVRQTRSFVKPAQNVI